MSRHLLGTLALVGIALPAHAISPQARDDLFDGAADEPLVVDAPGVLDNDEDPDTDTDALIATLVDPPAVGLLQLHGHGGFSYVPPPGFAGRVWFTYQASDGVGTSGVATAWIDILDDRTLRVYRDEASFLADVAAAGLVVQVEDFEDDAAWGSVRTTVPGGQITAPVIEHRGISWTANHVDGRVTTGEGPARGRGWGFFTLPHGAFATGVSCHVPVFCGDGWAASSATPLYAIGGWVETNTPYASLRMTLDDDLGRATAWGNGVVTTAHRFFGVVSDQPFHAAEILETEGVSDDQKFIFADDYRFAVTADLEVATLGACPGTVRVRVRDATPASRVLLVLGDDVGLAVVPGGPCEGTAVSLQSPSVARSAVADGSGEARLRLQLPAAACGLPVQALDLGACALGPVVRLP